MTAPDDEQSLHETRMSFGEHLNELRTRLFKALIASFIGLVIAFIFHVRIMRIVVAPFRNVMEQIDGSAVLNVFGPAQGFFSYVKVSLVVGVILTSPFWIYQLWAFVAAGLYSKERHVVKKYVPMCVVLFGAGITFGYFILIPIGLRYLLTFGDPTLLQNMIGLKEYLGLFTVLTLVLGLTFQLPVVMIGLARVGMVTPDVFRTKRKWTILGIFVMGAVLTPPDPVTQCLLATPLIGLYEVGIFVAWLGMGSGRPPIRWREKWPLLRKVLIVAALLFLLRGPLLGIWYQSRVEDRLYAEQAGKPDMARMATEALGRTVHAAYRAAEDGREAWVAARTDEKTFFLKVRRERQKSVVSDRKPDATGGPEVDIVVWPSNAPVYVLKLPETVRIAEVLPALLKGFEYGSDEVKGATRAMLESLTGSGTGDEDSEALSAFKTWYAKKLGARLTQVPPPPKDG